jgi:hypothetical protein
MNRCYSDILDRIKEEPKWFDENAVPRYCNINVNDVADIYAYEVLFAKIACQACQHEFVVAFSCGRYNPDTYLTPKVIQYLSDPDEFGPLLYGDPPNINCCDAGPTMNSEFKSIIEFWKHDDNHNWFRVDLDTLPKVEKW